MFCPACSTRWPTTASFCADCGARLERPVDDEAFDGQRRVVTVVMSDLSGYTAMGEQFDAEEIAEIMGVIKREGSAIIESYGGIVNQFLGDEIVSLFGVPNAADDDARRAVSAALALHAEVDRLNDTLRPRPPVPLSMHTGIFTGRLVLVADDSRDGVYSVTGDAINTAARVLGLAGRGELLIGTPTRDVVAPYFDLEFAGAHEVRNKAEPLEIHRVIGERPEISRFDASVQRGLTAFAGRDGELARLSAALDAAFDGRSSLVVVEAEAGTGKSRLAFEFAKLAADRGDVQFVKGRCQAFGSVIPYLPFQQVVHEVLGVETGATAAAIDVRLAEIDAALGAFTPAYLHLVGSLQVSDLPTEWQGEPLPGVLSDAIVALVTGVAQQRTTILLLEDWHWSDGASHRVLEHLAADRAGTGLVIVVAQRPGERTLDDAQVDDLIHLPPLGPDGTHAMIAARFGASGVDPALTRAVHDRTAGRPLFVEEVCAALADDGHVHVLHDTVVIADEVDDLAIPDSVQAVVLGRVDALDRRTRNVVRIASVMGREFDDHHLAELIGAEEVAEALPVLIRGGFVEPMTPGRHRFRHIITQEVTYESLLVRERRQAHARIAALLEREQVDVEPPLRRRVEMLADHHCRAGNAERAMVHYEVAGRRAVERRALAEARQMLAAAIDESRKLEQSAEVRQQRGRLALEWAAACIFLPSRGQIDLLESVVAEAIADGNFGLAFRAQYWISWILYSIGDQLEAERITRELLAALGDDGGPFTSVLRCHLGQVLRCQERREEAVQELLLGLPPEFLAEDGHPERITGLRCYSLAQLALLETEIGQVDEARRLMDRSVELVRSTPERSTEASIMVCVALGALTMEDWTSATDAVAAIDDLPDASVSPFVRITATCIDGYATVRRGQVADGLTRLQRGVAAHESSEAHLSLGRTRSWLADALSRSGDVDGALTTARAALERTHVGDRYGLSLAEDVIARHC